MPDPSNPANESAPWREHPLFQALRERRSRRVGRGMHLPGGSLEYRSPHPPLPLTEEETAILAFAACGITGPSLGDWDYRGPSGGNMMAGFVGRTVGSADGIQNVAVFVISDDGTWLARRPRELPRETLEEVIRLNAAGEFLEAWRLTRVKVSSGRTVPPFDPPYNVSANRWQLLAPGTTYFLPVADLTLFLINVLLEVLSPESGAFPLDERNLYRPAGVGRFARSRGGHLDDSSAMNTVPVNLAERLIAEMTAVETGMVLQNLGLACDALGLGGTPTFAGDDWEWPRALGFRMETMPVSRFFGLPRLLGLGLRLQGRDVPMSFPLALEVGGEVLLRPFCPPYFPSMADAVRAVVEFKFGEGGIYRGGSPNAWRDPAAVAGGIQRHDEAAVEATIAFCEYLWGRYGRFPVTLPPFHLLMGFQAHHLDVDFYDRYYGPGAVTDRHRHHEAAWHGAPPASSS